MGGQISKMMGKIFGSKEMRLLMLGLDAAGKTSKSLPERQITNVRTRSIPLEFLGVPRRVLY
jgi:ADP-ribosylation factor family